MFLKSIIFTILFGFNLLPAATLSLESGTVTIDNSENAPTCKTFRQTYTVPPVVYAMMDDSGNNNAIIKLTNVTTTQFCAKVMETIFEDGPHISVPAYYVAIPQGVYRLPDGTKVEAGIKTISNVVNDDRTSNSWTTLSFSHAYSQPPSVITQLQTMNNELPEGNTPAARGTTNDAISIPWVTETVNNITSSSAQIALDKSHIIETGLSITQGEKVGYFVIESNKFGSFTATDTGTNPVYYQTFLSGNVFAGYGSNGTSCNAISINNAFPNSGYLFIASKAINNPSYGGWLRKCNETGRQIGLEIDSKRAKGSGKVSGQKWVASASPDYGLSVRDHPAAPASIAVFSRSFDLSRVVNDANLSLSASVQPSAVIESGSLTMDVNISNKGPDSAPNTILSFSLPSGMIFQQITGGGANWSCTQNSNALDCNLTSGALAANTTSMLSLKFSAPSIANFYTVNVSAASDGLDDDGAGTTAQFQVYNLLVDDDKVECPIASFTTIAAALTNAIPGDTVQICKGTYIENNLAITQNNLTLQGYSGNRDDVMINTASSAGLTLAASSVTIKNLSIASTGNSNYGITDNWQGSGSHTFQNLSISTKTDSIYLGQNSLNNTFSNLVISSSAGKGIALAYNASGNHIFSNTSIQSYDNSIDIAHSGTLNVSDINITSTNGIGINASSGITLLQNFNITAKTYGVNAVFGQDSTIQQGFITTTNNNGINLSWGSAHILSIKDTVISAGGTGIYIPVASSATIDHVCITTATYGIKADWNALNVTIKNSKFTNNTNNAVNIDSDPSHNAIVTNNCFRTSPFAYRNNTAHTFNSNYWYGIAPSGYDSSPLSSCPINSCYSPTQTTAEYRMDECAWNGTDGEVIDSSNSFYNATPKSDNGTIIPQISAQVINNGAIFVRTNKQYVQLPTLALNQPNFNDGFTVMTWAKFSSAGSWERIFDFGNGTNVNNIFLGRQGTSANLVLGIHDPGTDNYLVASNAISDTNWHFWGATCNGSGGCKLYKDGVKIAESSTMKIPVNVARTKNYIGKSNWSADAYLEGGVDEFKIFDVTLSDSEVLNIYNNENSKNNYDGTSRTALCCCLPTGGNLIANPSFETLCNSNILTAFGNVAGGTVNSRSGLCGWDVAYSLETWENTTSPAASNGTIFTEIDGNSGQVDKIWQMLNTVAGTNYIISFDYRKRDTSHSDFIVAKWNDVAVTQVEGNAAGWQTAQIQVTGTAGVDKISFEEPVASDDGFGSWIDNIRVVQGTLVTDCTSFKYEPYHSYNASLTPSYRLQTRVANQPFDVNVTVACADSGTVPSRKIKNIYAIDALATSCNAATPKLFTLLSNGAYDINETSRVITIPNLNITKAYSNIQLMLETNASEFNCSSDSFAIRPPSFSITSPTTSAKAANFTLQISANNSGTGYHGTANVTTGLQAPNPNCPVSSGFLKSSISPTEPLSLIFQNDSNSSTAKATDVGTIYLNTKDTTWTAIDQSNDCIVDSNTTIMNTQGLLGCNIENNLSLSITPDHFDVNATLSDFGGGFTYLSNDLNMSAQLGLIITAENDENTTTQNYTAGCYSKDTTVTLPHSAVPDPLTKILYSEALSGVNSNVIKSNPWILTFNSGLFNSGSVAPNIDLNFDRNETKPLNPFNFTVTSATATDPDTTGTGTPLGTAKFVYGRARAYDVTTNFSPTPNPVEFEVYSTTSSGFVSGMPQNVLHWYRNLNHDAANQGNVIQGSFSAGTVNSNVNVSAVPQEGVQIINVTSAADQTVHLDISKWLWYSSKYNYLYSGTCSQHPCFNYDYTDTNAGVNGVNSGTFNGSDFQMTPAKNITNKGVKLFR